MTITSATFADAGTAEKTGSRLCFSDIVSALSLAVDLTEGAVPGHALRSCLLGMRIAAALHLDPVRMHDLYFALLLKDVGCSSNAARMCQIIGGDDRTVKAAAKLEDWTRSKPKLATLKMLWGNVLPESGVADRLLRIVQIGLAQQKHNEELITLRCDRGAHIVRKLGLGETVAEGVRCLDEHWNGKGYPDGLMGSRIPLTARIMQVAQHLDVFSTSRSRQEAIFVLIERSGEWFDPELVSVAADLHRRDCLWEYCSHDTDPVETRRAVLDIEPGAQESLEPADIDRICEAFADVVDAKSPFTFRHSMGVAEAARGIAQTMNLSAGRVELVHRAALLHDIGKLNVSNMILDKAGRPTDMEWKVIREHPAITRRILQRVGAFAEIALVAGEHHEKLDGSGYPDGLSASDLSLESRILTVADIYGALSENRPYREGMPLARIVEIMSREIPKKLDEECFEALLEFIVRRSRAGAPQSLAASLPVCPATFAF